MARPRTSTLPDKDIKRFQAMLDPLSGRLLQIMLKLADLRARGLHLCPQILAQEMGFPVSGRISKELRVLEDNGFIKRTRHDHFNVEIEILKETKI